MIAMGRRCVGSCTGSPICQKAWAVIHQEFYRIVEVSWNVSERNELRNAAKAAML